MINVKIYYFMPTKKRLVTSCAIIGVSLVVAVFILYVNNKLPGFKEKCLLFSSRNARVKVRYPEEFFGTYHQSGIQIESADWNDPNKELILDIGDTCCSHSVDALIEEFNIDFPGHEYKKGTFNGHEAVTLVEDFEGFELDDEIWHSFYIPISNAVIRIIYRPSLLSEKERAKAEKMLQRITLEEENIKPFREENINQSRVERCD